jgi:molecular chaperone GrpE
VTKKKESSNTTESEVENTTDEVLEAQEEAAQDTEETVDSSSESVETEDESVVDAETPDEIAELEEKLSASEEREKSAEDKLLRTLAEFENFKKRQEVEKVNFIKYANEKMILDLLPVMDSFTMAKPQFEETDQKVLQEGFLLILKQLETFFERMGIEKIASLEEAFDPNLHQAISSEEVEGTDSNKVIKVMQDGFKMADKVIRPAMVVVSK